MKTFQVAVVEQTEGIPYLFTNIKFDSSTALFFDLEGESLGAAIEKDLEYRPIYRQTQIRTQRMELEGKQEVITLDPLGSLPEHERHCEMILIPLKSISENHYVLFCSNMVTAYKNMRGKKSQQPINLVHACDVQLHPMRTFMALEHFGEVVVALTNAELL